jgi:hypothetical protein
MVSLSSIVENVYLKSKIGQKNINTNGPEIKKVYLRGL